MLTETETEELRDMICDEDESLDQAIKEIFCKKDPIVSNGLMDISHVAAYYENKSHMISENILSCYSKTKSIPFHWKMAQKQMRTDGTCDYIRICGIEISYRFFLIAGYLLGDIKTICFNPDRIPIFLENDQQLVVIAPLINKDDDEEQDDYERSFGIARYMTYLFSDLFQANFSSQIISRTVDFIIRLSQDWNVRQKVDYLHERVTLVLTKREAVE